MNLLQKDEIGVPSTLVAILANVSQAIGLDFYQCGFYPSDFCAFNGVPGLQD